MPTPSGLPDQELGPEEGRRPAWWRRLIAWGLRGGATIGRSRGGQAVGRGLRRITGRGDRNQ